MPSPPEVLSAYTALQAEMLKQTGNTTVATLLGVPAGIAHRPPITVSSNGWRVKPGAVGHSRRVSSRICRM